MLQPFEDKIHEAGPSADTQDTRNCSDRTWMSVRTLRPVVRSSARTPFHCAAELVLSHGLTVPLPLGKPRITVASAGA